METKKEKNKVPAIYPAMSKIFADITSIGKNKTNAMQRYKFRGIDDIYNTLHSLFAESNVFILPEVISKQREERQTKAGGNLIYTSVEVKYTFVCGVDGSQLSIVAYGEGMDSSDKSTNKAMSAALKYALLQTFLIPTEDDADKTTPEPVKKEVVKDKIDLLPTMAAFNIAADAIASGKFSEDKVLKKYKFPSKEVEKEFTQKVLELKTKNNGSN